MEGGMERDMWWWGTHRVHLAFKVEPVGGWRILEAQKLPEEVTV
jgi:hypothetical protein